MYKRLYFIGFAAYLALFIFSVIFYKERTAFSDIAFTLFSILKDNTFAGDSRFGAYLTQLFPLFASRAGLSLSGVMMSYSVGFVFYHFIYYLICGLLCRRYEFGLIILLFNLVFVSQGFYWVQSEFPQGMNLMIACFAMASTYRSDSKPLVLSAIFLGFFTVMFMHPLIIFPVLYVFFFLMLSNSEAALNKKFLFAVLVFCAGTFLIKFMCFNTAYDSGAIDGGLKGISLSGIFDIYSNKRFLENCLIKYYWIPILSIIIVIYYLLKRAWLKNIMFLSFMIGMLELVNLTHAYSKGFDYYLENLYLPLGIFIALPLVLDILPSLKWRYVPESFFTLILLTGCIRIYNTHEFWTGRLNWERETLIKYKGQKIIMDEKEAPLDRLFTTWGTAWEFWLLSTTELGKTSSILITPNPESYNRFVDSSKSFVVGGGDFNYATFHSQYFNFTDTVSRYVIIR